MYLTDRHHSKIEQQSLHELEKAFSLLVDMEVEHENKLKIIGEVKTRIIIEIDKRVNK